MNKYLILTSKPGLFHTPVAQGLTAVEAYEYVFCGKTRARFVVVELAGRLKVDIVDEEPPYMVSRVPSHLMEQYDTVDDARASLQTLVGFGSLDVELKQVPLNAAEQKARQA